MELGIWTREELLEQHELFNSIMSLRRIPSTRVAKFSEEPFRLLFAIVLEDSFYRVCKASPETGLYFIKTVAEAMLDVRRGDKQWMDFATRLLYQANTQLQNL